MFRRVAGVVVSAGERLLHGKCGLLALSRSDSQLVTRGLVFGGECDGLLQVFQFLIMIALAMMNVCYRSQRLTPPVDDLSTHVSRSVRKRLRQDYECFFLLTKLNQSVSESDVCTIIERAFCKRLFIEFNGFV